MSTTKREREHARRREAKWTQRQAQNRARKQRTWTIVGAAAGLVVVAGVVVATLSTNADAGAADKTLTLPPASAAQDREWTGELRTSAGDIAFTLDGQAAPQSVANFVTLAQGGYFDDTDCHRLTISGIYVLQCGDPTGTGTGTPGYTYGPLENVPDPVEGDPGVALYPAGTIAMARGLTADSQGSQFFLVYEDTTLPTNTGGYTVFGKITSGLDVVRAVADAGTADGAGDGSPATPVTIEGVETQ